MHAFFIVFIFIMNFWLVYLIYLFMAIGHFVFAKVWRYLFITNVYLSDDFKKVIFKNIKDEAKEFNCNQIIKCSTYNGITDIVIEENENKLNFYFMVNSKENLKNLSV